MRTVATKTVKHIVYESSPTEPKHGDLRVSYSPMHSVFVTRFHGSLGHGEYHDHVLTDTSLGLLQGMVPWLYRTGMPTSYEARENVGVAEHGGGVMLAVRISLRAAEDREWEAEQGIYDRCAYEASGTLHTLNRAGEWIKYGNQKPINLTIQHRLWYDVIKEMSAAVDALDAKLAGPAIHGRVVDTGPGDNTETVLQLSSVYPGQWIPVRVPKRDPGE